METRIHRGNNTTLKEIINTKTKGGWMEVTQAIKQEINITEDDMTGSTQTTKDNIRRKICEQFKMRIEEETHKKSKLKYMVDNKMEWMTGRRPPYMNLLTRNQASTIFKTRARMLRIKGNYKNEYPNQTCRLCHTQPETHQHILEECPVLHKNDDSKVTVKEIFNENVSSLKTTCKKLEAIMTQLEEK